MKILRIYSEKIEIAIPADKVEFLERKENGATHIRTATYRWDFTTSTEEYADIIATLDSLL